MAIFKPINFPTHFSICLLFLKFYFSPSSNPLNCDHVVIYLLKNKIMYVLMEIIGPYCNNNLNLLFLVTIKLINVKCVT